MSPMTVRCLAFGMLLALVAGEGTLALAATRKAAVRVPDTCPITLPPDPPFVPPTPYPARPEGPGHFWYGTEQLWTRLPSDGKWGGTPPDQGYKRGYRNKLFWWRPGYDGSLETQPELVVDGRRLDGEAPDLHIPRGTNAHFGGWAMLVAPDIPTPGCWELTGRFAGQELTFVVWVAP